MQPEKVTRWPILGAACIGSATSPSATSPTAIAISHARIAALRARIIPAPDENPTSVRKCDFRAKKLTTKFRSKGVAKAQPSHGCGRLPLQKGEGWGEGLDFDREVRTPLTPTLSPLGRGCPAVPQSKSVLTTKLCVDRHLERNLVVHVAALAAGADGRRLARLGSG